MPDPRTSFSSALIAVLCLLTPRPRGEQSMRIYARKLAPAESNGALGRLTLQGSTDDRLRGTLFGITNSLQQA